MPFNPNFDEILNMDDENLIISGVSGVEPPGFSFVSRHVTVQQDGGATPAPVSGEDVPGGGGPAGGKWTGQLQLSAALPAAGYHEGPALAIGTETHFSDDPPSFVMVTWCENVTIDRA